MKSEIRECEVNKDIEYPCLMKGANTGKVVLFHKYEKGTIVNIGRQIMFGLGYYSDDYDMEHFIPFNGTIELSND